MGCKNSTPAPQGTLLEQYAGAQLPQPWSTDYENDFEKQIYMAINLCRHDPKKFVPHVRAVYKDHVLLKGVGTKMNDLIAKLQATETLSVVRFDGQANEAARQNNTEVVDKNEDVPTKGGNIAKLTAASGEDKTASCFEFTMPKFEGSTGTEFVALQLALDFEDFDKPKEQKDAPTEAVPAEGEAQANAIDAPDKGEAEADKAAAAPAKKATVVPGSSPILDAGVELVGISNKAHKKCKNVIQVLYCKAATNALV